MTVNGADNAPLTSDAQFLTKVYTKSCSVGLLTRVTICLQPTTVARLAFSAVGKNVEICHRPVPSHLEPRNSLTRPVSVWYIQSQGRLVSTCPSLIHPERPFRPLPTIDFYPGYFQLLTNPSSRN